MGKAVEITDTNFDEILQSEKPILVDFWAEWCPPCKITSPLIDELAEEYEGKAIIGKLNVDENPKVYAHFGIRSAPTFLFLKRGKIVDKQVGAVPKRILIKKLEAVL